MSRRNAVADAIETVQGVRRSAPYQGQDRDLGRAREDLRRALFARSQSYGFIGFFAVGVPLSGGLYALQDSGAAYLPGAASFLVHGAFLLLAAGAGHLAQRWRQASLEARHAAWLTMPLPPNE